jgi:hypothetical protein
MARGFDCASPLTLEFAQKFKADGYEFVARYLPLGMWKSLCREEAEAISKAGLQIVSVFETSANRALGGYQAGLEDGARAAEAARTIGQPEQSAIYFAVDFATTNEQMPMIIDYIRGCSEATPTYKTGVYGSYSVIKAVVNANVCSKFWQTYAWSGGNFTSYSNIFQHQNDIEVNGIGVDLNTSYGNEGWWNLDMAVQPQMSVEDATVLIGFAKAAFRQGVTKIELEDGSFKEITEQDIRNAANAARLASGQKVQ